MTYLSTINIKDEVIYTPVPAFTTNVISFLFPNEISNQLDTLADERSQRCLLIGRDKNICQGEPILVGTRISVVNIVELHHLLGWSVERIQEEYPQLTVQQIHAALEYYEENNREIDGYLQEEKEVGEE